jgi:hypothetical protein
VLMILPNKTMNAGMETPVRIPPTVPNSINTRSTASAFPNTYTNGEDRLVSLPVNAIRSTTIPIPLPAKLLHTCRQWQLHSPPSCLFRPSFKSCKNIVPSTKYIATPPTRLCTAQPPMWRQSLGIAPPPTWRPEAMNRATLNLECVSFLLTFNLYQIITYTS